MPRKKKSDLGKRSNSAKRAKLRRKNETPEKRFERLAVSAERVAQRRADEDDIVRFQRLSADAERIARKRAAERKARERANNERNVRRKPIDEKNAQETADKDYLTSQWLLADAERNAWQKISEDKNLRSGCLSTNAEKNAQEIADADNVEAETSRRSSRRAAQVATQKIHNTVCESGRIKSIFSEGREWHSIRAPVPDIDLLMECHEELLSPVQAEAILKAQYEYNCVMKKLRDLKASNARIICTNYDDTAMPILPVTKVETPMGSSSSSSSSQKITNVITLTPTGTVLNSTNSVKVVPMHLVSVHPQLSSIPVQPKGDSPTFIASDRLSHNDSKYFLTTFMLHQRS